MNEDALFPATPVEVRADPTLQSIVLDWFRADIELYETYEPVPGEPLGCPVTVFAGSDERAATLFTADGAGGLWTNDTGEPIVCRGHQKLKAHGEWSLQCFPDCAQTDVEIYSTQDPNRFWVECDGEGKILFPGYTPSYHKNQFIHSFEFENGKIKLQREFMNPFEQLRALAIDVPAVRRDGIPT